MIELPDGKIARTLPEQVEFLSEKVKELILAFNQSGLKKIEVVEELPEEGDPAILYLLAVEDPEEGNYYEEYLWIDGAWEMIGTTQVDLSNYVNLDGEQTITGAKTFSSDIKLGEQWKINTTLNAAVIDIYRYSTLIYRIGPSNFSPNTTNTMDLGYTGSSWKDLYLAGKAYFGSEISLDATSNASILDVRRLNTIYYRFGTSAFYANQTLNLGTSTQRWNYTYTNYVSDGTNSVAVADIGKKLYKHTIQTDGGGGADLFILSTRSSAYTLPIDWLSLNTEAVKFLYNGCLVLRVYESGGVYYAQYINDSNTITNSVLSASTIEDTVAAL